MTQFDNTNRGTLFTNDRKESDSHPDMKGKMNINGTDHWVSAWWKSPRAGGDQFLSISIGKPVEAQTNSPPPRRPER